MYEENNLVDSYVYDRSKGAKKGVSAFHQAHGTIRRLIKTQDDSHSHHIIE